MIPGFNHNYVLPPYITAPTLPDGSSPYHVDILEFCQHFATSEKRIDILKHFVDFRLRIYKTGFYDSIQWVDGSFVEDKMLRDGTEPNDIDVLTFVPPNLSKNVITNICINFQDFLDPRLSKKNYYVDHYPVVMTTPLITVKNTCYWLQLFSHNRFGVWKGMVELPLYSDDQNDIQALTFLNSVSK